MEPEGSLPLSQAPATCPYPEPARFSPYPHIPLPEHPVNIILPSKPGSSKLSLFLRFPHKTLYTPLLSPIRTKCPAHPILHDFIARTILGKEYRSLSYSICSFLIVPLRAKFSQHSILKHPQPTSLPQCVRPSFTPIQKKAK